MRENRLRTLWQQNKHAVNGWLAIPNSFSAEVMAHQGWDTLTIDMQHGVIDYAPMVTMLQAISTTPTVPIVRVPWLEPGIIMKSLDAGAYGIICPMVNTREDAQRWSRTRITRRSGSRSFGPVRATLYGGPDYAAAGQRHHRRVRDDRDQAGARQPRRHPVGRGARCGLHRPVGPVARARLPPGVRRRRPAGGAGDRAHPSSAPRRMACAPACTTACPRWPSARAAMGFDFVTLSSDARILIAGSQQLLAAMK